MSDEPRVIAELEDFMRVTESGQIQQWNDPEGGSGFWVSKCDDDYIPGSVLAELLADARQRAREELTALVAGVEERLTKCIEAVDDSVNQDHVAMHEMEIRLAALEQDPFVEHGKRQALEERVLEVERLYAMSLVESGARGRGLADRLTVVENSVRFNTRVEEWHNKLVERVAAGESGQKELHRRIDANSPVRAEFDIECLSSRVRALEARQQDEAIKGVPVWDPNLHGGRGGYASGQQDEAGEPDTKGARFWKEQGRKQAAREIAERLREREDCFRECTFCDALSVLDVADWIEREFEGGGVELGAP